MANFPPNQERAEARSALELEARSILDRLPALVVMLTASGAGEHMNRRAAQYLGEASAAPHDGQAASVVHPDDLPRALATFSTPLATAKSYELEYRLRGTDGRYRWFEGRALSAPDGEGGVDRWYLLLLDIEARKQAEGALRRSEALLAKGQRLSLTGTFSWRVDQDEIFWSEQVYRIFELEPGARVTFALLESRLHPEDLSLFRYSINRARETGGDFEHEVRLLLGDGVIKHVHVVAEATRHESQPFEYVGAIQDVTARRVAEQTLDNARSELSHVSGVMSLGVLAASIAHEINQPLSGVVTNASTCLRLLAADPPNVEVARETARRTIHDGVRAAEVTRRLRALFSRQGLAAEAVDLNEVARDVIALSAHDLRQNRVVVRQELAEGLPPVSGDRVQLQQVVLNFFLNASDAMSTLEERPRQLVVRTERDEGDYVRLIVKDCGVGFDAKSAGKLFEAFYTTKASGMGIGLSVSRSIIESHGGRIWATLNDGPGATFAFSLHCAM